MEELRGRFSNRLLCLLRDDEFEGMEDEDELEGEVEEEGDSGFEDGTVAGRAELDPLLQSDGANDVVVNEEKEKSKEQAADIPATSPKHDIKLNLEQQQERSVPETKEAVSETASGVVEETRKMINTASHRNGASFMAACLVAAAAIVLVWGRK